MPKHLAILTVSVLLAVSATAQPSKGAAKDKVAGVTNPQAKSQSDEQRRENPPTVVVQVAPQQSDASETKKKENTDSELARYTLWLAVFTGVLTIVSGFQGYFLFRQARHLGEHAGHLDALAKAAEASSKASTEIQIAISKQAELMEKTLILQFRPRVVIRGGYVDGIRDADTKEIKGGIVQLAIANTGGTVAHISNSKLVVKALDYSVKGFNLFDGATSLGEIDLQPGDVLPAEVPISVELVNDLRHIAEHQNESPFLGRKFVYLVGKILYADDLGIKRSLGIFRKFDPKQLTFVALADSYSEYND